MRRDNRIALMRRRLCAWYARHARDLPWRRTKNPYAIWVSEVMLQQTRVATAVPYFKRFLRRFPDVRALARAPLDAVLKTWEGLGYYGRARNLHCAARTVVSDWGGELPRASQDLLRLPGIGRYTAGAIASIAFGLDEPVLDGNVTRVLCRVFRVDKAPASAKTQRRLWTLARRLIPAGRAGLLNQSLMDLGATVCTPRHSACPRCPLEDLCLAHARGEGEKLPVKVRRKPIPHYEVSAGVVWKRGRILIDRRPSEGLLGGLWEFPGGRCLAGETLEECVVREIREELGIRVRVRRPLVTVKHAYSHFRITLHVFECDHSSGRPKAIACAAWKWVRPKDLDRFAFPQANRKVIAELRKRHT